MTGAYRVTESEPSPVDGCDGRLSRIPYTETLLCDRDAEHRYEAGGES